MPTAYGDLGPAAAAVAGASPRAAAAAAGLETLRSAMPPGRATVSMQAGPYAHPVTKNAPDAGAPRAFVGDSLRTGLWGADAELPDACTKSRAAGEPLE